MLKLDQRWPPLKIDLAQLFSRHERVHLAFSGGRDSIVLADLCRPWRDQVTLVWANTGIMWPHMVRFVRDYGEHFRLLEVTAKQDAITHWREAGFPVNVAPLENILGRAQPRLQFWHSCCFALRWKPVVDAVSADGGTAFLHGQRASDNTPVPDHQAFATQFENVEVAGPIWDWTPDDVQRHVGQHSLALPYHYARHASSLECAICPAHHSANEHRLEVQLSPAIARATAVLGAQLRDVTIKALLSIQNECSNEAEDRPTRWAMAAPIIASALEYDTPGKTIDDIKVGYLSGRYEVLMFGRSALLIEFIEHKGQRLLHLYLGGGRMHDLVDILIPEAELLAKLRDCHYSVVGGRRGWSRVLRHQGYSYLGRSALPYSWVAIKPLRAGASECVLPTETESADR